MYYDTFSILHYGERIRREDWERNGNNYSEQIWEYEKELYIIEMKNGQITHVAKW